MGPMRTVALLALCLAIAADANINCEQWGKTLKCSLGTPGNLRNMSNDEITDLDFSDCNLRFVDPTWLKQFPKLSKVHLNGNQLDCSCYTRRKIKAFLDQKVKLFGHCAFPKEMIGVPLSNLTRCEEPSRPKRSAYFVPPPDLGFSIRPPREVTVNVGDMVMLNCSSRLQRYPVKWTKDDKEIIPSGRVQVSPDALLIFFARSSDAGKYQCKTMKDSTILTSETNLIVQGPPEAFIGNKAYFPVAGLDFELNCEVRGFPKPQISWTKNDRPITNSRVALLNGGSKLIIRNINERTDNGQYKCTARNIFGQSSAACEVQVTPLVPPYLQRPTAAGDLIGVVGGSVTLCCEYSGSPEPMIQWAHNGKELAYFGKYVLSADKCLTISNLTLADRGEYECFMWNVGGSARKNLHLEVLDPVTKPVPIDLIMRIKKKGIRERDNVTLGILSQILLKQLPNSIDEMSEWLRYDPEDILDLRDAEKLFRHVMTVVQDHMEHVKATRRYPLLRPEDVRPDRLSRNPTGLSALHIHRIAEMTGCFPHQLIPENCSAKCLAYRTADGTCNNLRHPMWGASQTPLFRWLPSQYENGFNLPKGWNESHLYNGYKLPSPRLVSAQLISAGRVEPDPIYTHMLMQWGQFVDHDFTHTLMATGTSPFSDARLCTSSCSKEPPCFPIRIPENDPRISSRGNCIEFVRSTDICLTGETSFLNYVQVERQQINQITSYIDASNVYGSTEQEMHDLREHSFGRGLLRMRSDARFPKRLLPFAIDTPVDCQRDRDSQASPVGCFLSGDHRTSEQLGLIAMHTIWARQHNRIASRLGELNPKWSSEQVFQEARKIVYAQQQHITYEHWIHHILGARLPPYTGYKPDVRSQAANAVATAAFRFGHTLINPIIYRLNATLQPIEEGNLLLRDVFFAPWRILEEGGIDPLLRGMFAVPAKIKIHGQILNRELTEHLFHIVREISQDLAALNIQRGRDHGLPSYVEWRAFCNLTVPKSFDDLVHCPITDYEAIQKLQSVYGDVRNIDLWVGAILEDVVENGKVGPLFKCLIGTQFTRLRDGDRFWYKNPGQFTPRQLRELEKTTLAKIVCENSDNITETPRDVFIRAKYPEEYVSCASIEDVNLEPWRNCCSGNVQGINAICNQPSIHNYNPLPMPRPYH